MIIDYHILLGIMHIFLPKCFREKLGCALYMGIMITYHGYNNGYSNPMYNAHKIMNKHYTRKKIVNLFTCLWSVEIVLFHHDSVLVSCMFLGIYPLILGCLIY